MKFTKEQIMKAVACKTTDELLALAKGEGIDLAPEEAEKFLTQLAGNELNMEDIENVAGGCFADLCGADISEVC